MRYIKYSLLFLIAVIIAVFAANNSQLVKIDLYPFPAEFSVAAFLLFFTAFALGVIFGGGVQSFRLYYWKRLANSAKKRAENAESELKEKTNLPSIRNY